MSSTKPAQHLTQHPPQPVTHGPGQHALFMVLTMANTPTAPQKIRDMCADFLPLVRSMRIRDMKKSIQCVMGFGSKVWDQLFGSPRPAYLHPFKELRGDKHVAPSTPGDIFFHLRADTMDVCFEFARLLMEKLGDAIAPEDEVHGFRYFDGRSMVGFVDGTENPDGDEAYKAAVIGQEDPDFTGGSYVTVQKYVHDMDAWNRLPIEEQERVIGRGKFNDIELDDDAKPANAHNAVTNIKDEEGNELKIVRSNLPFGSPASGEFGTYFIGYSRYPEVTERMLENMFIGSPKGNYDRLLDFSTAKTGSMFFVPSIDLLESLAQREPQISEAQHQASALQKESSMSAHRAQDGSLKVGSLKK